MICCFWNIAAFYHNKHTRKSHVKAKEWRVSLRTFVYIDHRKNLHTMNDDESMLEICKEEVLGGKKSKKGCHPRYRTKLIQFTLISQQFFTFFVVFASFLPSHRSPLASFFDERKARVPQKWLFRIFVSNCFVVFLSQTCEWFGNLWGGLHCYQRIYSR